MRYRHKRCDKSNAWDCVRGSIKLTTSFSTHINATRTTVYTYYTYYHSVKQAKVYNVVSLQCQLLYKYFHHIPRDTEATVHCLRCLWRDSLKTVSSAIWRKILSLLLAGYTLSSHIWYDILKNIKKSNRKLQDCHSIQNAANTSELKPFFLPALEKTHLNTF